MKPFSLLIAYDVLEFVLRLGRKEQLALRQRMLRIRDFPQNHSDYFEPDNLGRPFHIHIYGAYAIKYWIDDADRQIKILEIGPADRKQ